MIANQKNTTTTDRSDEQLYVDFAELIYDIYIDSRITIGDDNSEVIESQKLEYKYE